MGRTDYTYRMTFSLYSGGGGMMGAQHELGQLPLAQLTQEQLRDLQQAEIRLNQEGNPVYLIAFAQGQTKQREGE